MQRILRVWAVPLALISRSVLSAGGLSLSLVLAAGSALADDVPSALSFDLDVRPLLVGRCLDCHSGDRPASGLDLTTREKILEGTEAGPVLEPGDPEESYLLDLVADGTMPPSEADRLSSEEVAVLKKWIEDGARWSDSVEQLIPGSVTTDRRAGLDWWSLQPIERPPVPEVEHSEDDDNRKRINPIDSFILARLEAEGIEPVARADRRTLIRRLTFDLLGLPPTPEEVETFLNDDTPEAVERLVDRLLASSRYGERWARHWLDVVRFAESHGYEHDNPRPNAWPYRDYVIKSLNDDKPFDQFVKEQLAGDILAPDDPEVIAATGFLVAGTHDEVGSKVKSAVMRANVRQDELEDLIGVTAQAFLGLTVHCARCHNHKFDPISQEDYYRIQGAFAGVWHGGPEIDQRLAHTPVIQTPEPVPLLHRGDVESPGKVVLPGALSALQALPTTFDLPEDAPEGQRRLALAHWIVDPKNPLTPRVIVNRIWQHHFGEGLIATPSDFGFNGARPTHPELLDWLASEFIDGGWSIKSLHRLILLSSTYQRSSQFDDSAASVDANNQLLWRMSPRRITAEELRDSILAISGQLNPEMGGPGYPLFEATKNAGTLYRPVDREGSEYQRRSIYRMVVRGMQTPLLAAFDCPDASTTTPERSVSTTPLQALGLWNDALILRQAEAFASRLQANEENMNSCVDLAYLLAFSRPPASIEREKAQAFIDRQSLELFCRVLLNSNEFLVID